MMDRGTPENGRTGVLHGCHQRADEPCGKYRCQRQISSHSHKVPLCDYPAGDARSLAGFLMVRSYMEQPEIIFPCHPNGFHIIENYCDRDFIVTGYHNCPFCNRVMVNQMIAALADECASRFFKYPDLSFPVSGGYFFHRASQGNVSEK